jgi:hypothetical protein
MEYKGQRFTSRPEHAWAAGHEAGKTRNRASAARRGTRVKTHPNQGRLRLRRGRLFYAGRCNQF